MLALFTPPQSTWRAPLVLLAVASLAISARPRAAPPTEPPVVLADPPRWAISYIVHGVLLDDNRPPAHCGVFMVHTTLRFEVFFEPSSPGADGRPLGQLLVRVPCSEMPRPMYGRTAGNASVLIKGRSYELILEAPEPSGRGNATAWTALRIDDAPSPQRPATDATTNLVTQRW
jgi:hypothetical protein